MLGILIQQLLTATGNSVRIQTKESSQNAVAAVAEFERLQSGVQTALLFIEQTIEQDDGGLHFFRRYFEPRGVGKNRDGLNVAPCK